MTNCDLPVSNLPIPDYHISPLSSQISNLCIHHPKQKTDPKCPKIGTSSLIGHRPENQDVVSCIKNFFHAPHLQLDYYAVFDGHLGKQCSHFCSKYFPLFLKDLLSQNLTPQEALHQAYLQIDREYEATFPHSIDGSTAVILLVDRVQGMLYSSHAGDSRAILVSSRRVSMGETALPSNKREGRERRGEKRDGKEGEMYEERMDKVVAVTTDHKPDRADEKRRIEMCGARVVFAGCYRVIIPNVKIRLAISRAIGDFLMKRSNRACIIPDPDIKTYSLRDICGEKERGERGERGEGEEGDVYHYSIAIASDGVFDTLTNETLASILTNNLSNVLYGNLDPNVVATDICNYAIERGSSDNCSIICLWNTI